MPPAKGAAASGQIAGTVRDQAGAAVAGAAVKLLAAGGAELAHARTDAGGQFSFPGVAAANYAVVVSKGGFEDARRECSVAPGQSLSLEIQLRVGALSESVTVTPARGQARELVETPEAVSVTTADELSRRPHLILPQALREEPGLHLQQTTTAQGSLFLRGLTGQQVLNLIDGVRFNNSTFRPGANQYTAFIEPAEVERVEVVRGPNSTPYGSDSLGGTMNVLTRPAGAGGGGFELHGGVRTFFASADLSGGGSAHLSGGGRRWGFYAGGSGRRAQLLIWEGSHEKNTNGLNLRPPMERRRRGADRGRRAGRAGRACQGGQTRDLRVRAGGRPGPARALRHV